MTELIIKIINNNEGNSILKEKTFKELKEILETARAYYKILCGKKGFFEITSICENNGRHEIKYLDEFYAEKTRVLSDSEVSAYLESVALIKYITEVKKYLKNREEFDRLHKTELLKNKLIANGFTYNEIQYSKFFRR